MPMARAGGHRAWWRPAPIRPRTYQVKLALPTTRNCRWAPAYVTLARRTGQAAITLPTTACSRRAIAAAAWCGCSTRTRAPCSRARAVAGADGNRVVIAGGLEPGDEVVATGGHVLSAGQKVVRFVAQ